LAFSSSMTGDSEIYTADSSGTHLKRLTVSKGPDVSPAWNPKTGAQIAFVSARIGNLPQIFIMDSDGTNVQRLTDGGYAVSPSWSPNGELLAFAWRRNYGPGEPGAQDIYIMDIATRQWVQLTHESGVCDFPTWSPDGRHIDYECKQHGKSDIWSMLADGSKPHSLTASGDNSQPNWSFK
jgi:TolB protein